MDRSSSGVSGLESLDKHGMKLLNWLFLLGLVAYRLPARYDQAGCLEYRAWDLVMDIALSNENDLLAVSAGNNIHLYQAQGLGNHQEFQTYPVGSFSHSIKFSPDGSLLAAGSRDGYIRVWNLPEGSLNPVISVYGHKNGVNTIAFSHDGSLLASGGNEAVIRIWDIETGELVIEMIGGSYAVPAIEFSPDSQHIAIANGEVVRLRDIGTGQIWGTIRSPGWVYDLSYNLDGTMLAASDIDQQVHIWNPQEAYRSGVETYPEARSLKVSDSNAAGFQTLIWDVEFQPNEETIIAAYGDGIIRSWSLETEKLVDTWDLHSAGVTSIEISSDGTTLVSGSLDATVCFLRLSD